jgi:hypothetical protein
MQVPPIAKVAGGAVLIAGAIAIEVLEACHLLEYLKVELPPLYVFIVSPTAVAGMAIVGLVLAAMGFLEMRRQRHAGPRVQDPPASQSTSGPNSPAAAIGSIGYVGPGASVNVGTAGVGIAQVHLAEPILHIEPEETYSSKQERGNFTLYLVNTGLEDVERVALFVTCFIAQRFPDSVKLKRGGWMGPPQKLASLRVQEREAVPVKCAEILPIIREVGVRWGGPYIFGVRVLAQFRRKADGKDFERVWGYGMDLDGVALSGPTEADLIIHSPSFISLADVLPYLQSRDHWSEVACHTKVNPDGSASRESW